MSFEKTKKALEKIIEKPKISIALLERPPFKFIVDIVGNVIESTGYLKDEISKDELTSAGKDKESKAAFLEKLIKILDDGSLKDVKVSKIMSGIEAEETNKMLYRLGSNAKKFKENGDDGIKKKKKDKNGEVEKEKKKEKKEDKGDETPKTKKGSSRSETREKSSEKREKEERAPSEEKKKKKTSSSKERHKSSDKKEKKTKTTTDETKTKKTKKDPSERHLKRQDSMIAVNGDAPDTPNNDEGPGDEENDVADRIVFNNSESSQALTIQQDNSSHREEEKVKEEAPKFISQDMPPMARPMTGAAGGRPMTSMGRPGTAASRPAPPKLKKKQIATIEATPQVAIELKSEILTDSIPTIKLEDDDNFILENDEDDLDKTARVTEELEEEDRGALVQKIMETKAEIEDSATNEQEGDTEGDKLMSVEKEKVKKLQEMLQDLTRAAYPLARMFDYASDDIESMVKEMERWRTEQRKNEQEDQNRRATGLGDSSRLYNIIANLQKEIQELKSELNKARGRVLHNEKRINLLISNI